MRKFFKSEKGAMPVVEATIVFPVMFLVIFFLIFMGNAYFVKCKVEAIVTESTLDGAAYCADPMLYNIKTTGNIPAFDTNPEPYRYLARENPAEGIIKTELNKRLGNVSTGLFSGMKPSYSPAKVKFNNYYIYATFSIDLEYNIVIPVRLLGSKENMKIKTLTHAETTVTDVPEFMRNINMVEDYLIQTGIKEKIDDGMKKISDAIDKAKGFLN